MTSIAKSFTDRWWVFVLEGILSIIFGVAAWVWPGLTVATLVYMFAAFAIFSGIMNLSAASGADATGGSPRGFIFRGLLDIVTGVVVILWPGISALALLYVIGAWAVVTGIYQVVASIELRKLIDNEWALGLAGIASIAFGVFVAIFPGDGALALVWTIGIYAIAFGGLLVALGFRLQSQSHLPATATV